LNLVKMTVLKTVTALTLVSVAAAFAPATRFASRAAVSRSAGFDMEASIQKTRDMRLAHLEEQAMFALQLAVENNAHPVFPNAMIAGDCVITHLLGKLGYLKSGKVKIMVVDTLHLFPETMEFLKTMEEHYEFKAEVFLAEGCADRAEYDTKYGADLWKEDIEQYDKVCKVEPFQRGLKTLKTDCMINGRTRWQGFERAWIDMFENAPIGGGLAKVNPIAYWTFEDTFDYLAKYKVPAHPLHAKGYPSLGDAKDTIPIPEDGSVRFVDFKWEGDKTQWLDYATERKGRFVGLQNKDGSTKTECGIHVAGAEKTFDRDLWDASKQVKGLDKAGVTALQGSEDTSVLVVYAPWCQFCQGMEDSYDALAGELASSGVVVASYRCDEDRDYVATAFNVKAFPTINVFKGGKMTTYESEVRTPEAMKAFVESC